MKPLPRTLSHVLSAVLHPLFMPLFSILLIVQYSAVSFVEWSIKVYLLSVTALFTLISPLLFILLIYQLKLISSPTLFKREDRTLPYLFTMISYALCGYIFYKNNVPLWLIAIILGGLLSLVCAGIITRWWKISAHMTGIGGLLACAVVLHYPMGFLPLWLLCSILLLAGLLGSARIYLRCHTFGQVLAGWINGFAFVYLMMWLLR